MNNNVVSANPPTNHSHQNSPITNGGTQGNDVSQHQQHHVYSHNVGGIGQQEHHSQYSVPHNSHRFAHRDGPATINLPPGTRIQPAMIPDSTQVANVQQQQDLAAAMYGMYQNANNPQTGFAMQQSAYPNQQLATSGGHYYYTAPAGQYYTNTAGYPVTQQTLIMPQPPAPAYQILSQPVIPSSTHATQQLISSSGSGIQPQNVNVSIGMPATAVSMPQSNVIVSNAGGTLSSANAPTTQTQPQKAKRILAIVNPDSGESLKLGPDTRPATSIGSSAASDEETKSTIVKTDFFRKIAERAHESGAVPPQQANRRSPSSSTGMMANEAMNQALLEQQRHLHTTGSIPIIQKGSQANTAGFSEPTHSPQFPYLLHPPNSVNSVSSPIPIEQHSMPINHQHSPHNLPSILELNIKNPSPKNEEDQLKFVRTSPSLYVDEQRVRLPESDEHGKHANKAIVDIFSGQEVDGGQSPSPTEINDAKTSEEKISELEEAMAKFDGIRDDTHNLDEMIYSRSFLMLLRKVARAIKTVECPRSEQELEELGLSKKGMVVNQLSIGSKPKRFEAAGGDFKPSWQHQGGGGNAQFGATNQFGGGSRFGSTRPPNYVGRHSDNKLKPKKGPIVCRPSLDQRPTKIEKTDTLPKKSANAWKSKREERFDMNAPVKDEEEARHDKIKKEVRGLLNKITPSSYQELSDEFCAYKFIEDTKLLTPVIDLIFDKAVEEPHFCPLYSDLCKKQVDVERQMYLQRDKTPDKQSDKQSDQADNQAEKPKEKKNFRAEIITKSQRTFLASDEYDNKVKELTEKLETADDKTRVLLEEELETRRSKEKRRLLGIIKFIGQLYRHQLLIETIIDWCAVELVRRFEATHDEVYIEYAVELIETVGKNYEKRTEQEGPGMRQLQQPKTSAQIISGEKQQEQFRLDMVVSHLSQLKPKVSNRVRFAIMDLEDLKKNRWVPRGGEKGPKTINEVREEVEKEQQVNELERIAHEKQQDKVQLLRKPNTGRTGYGGRSSADRRQAAAASSLYPRDSKTESRISSARLSELDKESSETSLEAGY
uniref:MIF4G domain-containing protein n=1 Tax=Meloidogyne enterolobii TaxID=390850 RepID=A0A6V7UUN8_MELEN|nr:unnamed protein product [Meloidogyne enterolobii]